MSILRRKMKKEHVFYKEGQIILNDSTLFHFKYLSWLTIDDKFITIIDLYDNMIYINKDTIIHIFYHANNIRNEGVNDV